MTVQTSQKINEAVGRRLRLIRESKGWSQREMARQIGWSYTALCTLESARTTLDIDDLFLIAEQLGVSSLVILQDLITAEDLLGLGRALDVEREDVHQQIARATQRLDDINSCAGAVRRILPADGDVEHRGRYSSPRRCNSPQEHPLNPESVCGIRSDPPEIAWMLVDALIESKALFWQGLMLAGNTTQTNRTAEEVATDGYVLGDLQDTLGELFAWMSDRCSVEYGCPINVEMAAWLSGLIRDVLIRNAQEGQKPFQISSLDVYHNLTLSPHHMVSMLAEWSVHSFLETWREDTLALIADGKLHRDGKLHCPDQVASLPKTAAEFWTENHQSIRRWLYSWYSWALARGYCHLEGQSECADDGGLALEACVAAQIARWPGFFEVVNCTAVEAVVENC